VASLPLDLGNLENVAKCTDNLKSYLGTRKIDILVNNAGIMALPNREVL
jgi:short-subunit dehydrogenase